MTEQQVLERDDVTILCTRADGSTFLVEVSSDRRIAFTFEDPPEGQYHDPSEDPPDVVVFCKGVMRV